MTNLLPTRTQRRGHRARPLMLGALTAIAVLVTACATPSSPRNDLADNQRLLSTCDPAAPPASFVQLDGTGSSASDAITAERMAAVESIVRTTAICSGHLRVIVFSASSAATTVLFDGPVRLDGATDNARLKRVPGVVENVMDQIRQAYGSAVTALPGGGSDITAQYRLAAEWIGQLGDPYRLDLYVLTDGFQNIGVDLGTQALGKQQAAALTDQVAVPELPGASVTVAGLGRVVGDPPPSQLVEGLVAYYDALCQKTSAARCVSVSTYSAEGR